MVDEGQVVDENSTTMQASQSPNDETSINKLLKETTINIFCLIIAIELQNFDVVAPYSNVLS